MSDPALREHLVAMLRTGHAHVSFDDVTREWKPGRRGSRIPGAAHTAWQLLEHLRIAQWDILEFSRSADHVSPAFPEGYWPLGEAPPTDRAWDESVEGFSRDLKAMEALVMDPGQDLYATIPHGTGQTLLREALTLASHNSYHLGQLMALRKILESRDA